MRSIHLEAWSLCADQKTYALLLERVLRGDPEALSEAAALIPRMGRKPLNDFAARLPHPLVWEFLDKLRPAQIRVIDPDRLPKVYWSLYTSPSFSKETWESGRHTYFWNLVRFWARGGPVVVRPGQYSPVIWKPGEIPYVIREHDIGVSGQTEKTNLWLGIYEGPAPHMVAKWAKWYHLIRPHLE